MAIWLDALKGALQATISVLLVLSYGAGTTKYLSFFDEESVNAVTKVGTHILLPCLLFTQMGKEATPDQLVNYWIFAVFTTGFTALALAYAYIGIKLFKFPNWLAPAAAFPNTISLPLLLIESLSKTGGMDTLLRNDKDTVDKALDRGKTYFLVIALVGNILRWAIGPYVLRGGRPEDDGERQPLLTDPRNDHDEPLVDAVDDEEPVKKRVPKKTLAGAQEFFNPPLIAAILAIILGLIKPTRWLIFDEDGPLQASFTQSLTSLGKLYTALQMFALGGKLVSKKAGRAKVWPLVYLFLYRFAIVPAISGSIMYGIRARWPRYVTRDPMLDFALAISNVGPPAITLAAMADMAGLDESEQGVVATVLLASYVVTPLMAFSVSGIITVINKLYP
ncbi:auxin efflux carrier [Cystobasidium minutum MCA 4210]|uniref:auxin efflux carrier n=1 Tax=Cystobasidium minutum MCA 4210 TaxID=1397322 RepID=UPI0034CFA64A|eukprot:jgi/Rhomi1/166507/fgenesh1_kg.2_\